MVLANSQIIHHVTNRRWSNLKDSYLLQKLYTELLDLTTNEHHVE